MIAAKDAIAVGRALLGTPYSELDCINFIKKIIRTAPGGVPGYTVAGTNTLWRSYSMSEKYRDLTWRQEGIAGAQAGMLVFKRRGEDVHHVGLVTGDGTVLHSSSTQGCVVETALDSSWALLGKHRYIETSGTRSAGARDGEGDFDFPLPISGLTPPLETSRGAAPAPGADTTIGGNTVGMNYRATVKTQSGPLNMRSMASTAAARIMQIPRGAVVNVFQEDDGWAYVYYGGETGWVSAAYLERMDEPEDTKEDNILPEAANCVTTTLMREDADGCIALVGRWRVAED